MPRPITVMRLYDALISADPVDADAQRELICAPRLMIIEDSQSAQSGGYARA
jgi:hypothetical protein